MKPESYGDFRRRLLAGGTTCESTAALFLDRARERSGLNAFITLFEEEALDAARALDARIRGGEPPPPLAGMAVAVKDILSMKGARTTCGSAMLRDFRALYDATPVARLRDAGAVFIGKTNMDEFAMGSSNEHSAFGPARHPLDPARVPGGSSGGSAAAVAAGLSHAALGTDTGGSIRQPAAFCGVVGVKPTYGRVSRYGLVAFASSCDTVGPIAPRVEDAALLLQTIAGRDERDATSSPEPVPDFTAACGRGIAGLRIGVPAEYFLPSLSEPVRAAVEQAIDLLRREGAAVERISLPHTEYTIAVYSIIATAEASSNLARYDGVRYGHRAAEAESLRDLYVRSRDEGFGVEVKRRIMLGTYVLSAGYYEAYYRKAQKVRRLIAEDFGRAFERVDAVVTPATPTTAFRLGEKLEDPLLMYLSDVYSASGNLAGIPGISVPCGADAEGMPVGMQIYAKAFDEETMFRIAAAAERLTEEEGTGPEVTSSRS